MDATTRAFIDALPAPVGGRADEIDSKRLAAALAALVSRAHAAVRRKYVSDEVFVAHVATHCGEDGDLVAVLETLRAPDLFLAASCTALVPGAIEEVVERHFDEVTRATERFGSATLDADDAKQLLYEKIFVAEKSQRPKIAQYSGRGELRGWLRASAVRLLLDASQRGAKQRSVSDEVLEILVASAEDAELAFIKGAFREELRAALEEAAHALSTRDKNMLRYTAVEDLSVDQIGAIYDVHRATVARWIQRARVALAAEVQSALKRRLGVSESELESIVRASMSQLDITLSRYFKTS